MIHESWWCSLFNSARTYFSADLTIFILSFAIFLNKKLVSTLLKTLVKREKEKLSVAKLSSFSAHHPAISSHHMLSFLSSSRYSTHHCWHIFLSRLLMVLDVGGWSRQHREKTKRRREKPHQWRRKTKEMDFFIGIIQEIIFSSKLL